MVFFNASTRELTAKIVYYGPGLGGKTTNLKVLHDRLEPRTAGELVALATDSDRTIYFDLMPVELGEIKGYRIRFQLTTVPGQTAFNETRRVVLKGADGIVFVADSQWTLLPKNLESWQSLKENLAANGLAFDTMPIVIQYNKRDLPDILSVEAMQEALGFLEYPHVEAIASEGRGVTETFKLISKLTFLDLLRRLQGRPTPEAVGESSVGHAGRASGEIPADERRPALSLVPPGGEEPASEDAASAAADDSPFPEATAPFETASDRPTAELEERVRSLEAKASALEAARARDSEAIQFLSARLGSIESALSGFADRSAVAGDIAAIRQGLEDRIRAVEERITTERSAFARELEDLRRIVSDQTTRPGPEAGDLKLQLAPFLEERVRRETDENWTAEIERLRQALAESLDDLSERVRKAVRG